VILLDTHVVIWLAGDSGRISRVGRTAIEEARASGAGVAICDITMLELAILARKGRLRVDTGLQPFLDELESRFQVLPMTAAACARAAVLPASYPNDPADRIIGATAIVEDVALVTADRSIRRSKLIRTIW